MQRKISDGPNEKKETMLTILKGRYIETRLISRVKKVCDDYTRKEDVTESYKKTCLELDAINVSSSNKMVSTILN